MHHDNSVDEIRMTLMEYFSNYKGISILSTADANGKVDVARYSTPHLFDDETIAFIMRDRLTHHNLQSNPYAAYVFIEEGKRNHGIRLFLKKTKEETDRKIIDALTRRHLTPQEDESKGPKFLVYFAVEKILPLSGSGDVNVTIS